MEVDLTPSTIERSSQAGYPYLKHRDKSILQADDRRCPGNGVATYYYVLRLM